MRLALSEGRLSKWEDLLNELTLHQIRVLQAYAKIEPWGEPRADMRAAWHTSILTRALSASGDAPEPNALLNYLATEEETETATSPNAAAAMVTQRFPWTVK